MSPEADGTPVVLLHHLKHNKVLHETVILLTVKAVDVPGVNEEERITIKPLEQGFIRVVAKFGFMETPNVTQVPPGASIVNAAANSSEWHAGISWVQTPASDLCRNQSDQWRDSP